MASENTVGINFEARQNLDTEISKVIAATQGLTEITGTVIEAMLKEGMTGDALSQAVNSVAISHQQAKEAMQEYGVVVVSQTETNNEYYKNLFNNLEMEGSTREQALSDAKAYFTQLAELEKQQESIDDAYYKQLFQQEEMQSAERKQMMTDAKATFFTEEELASSTGNGASAYMANAREARGARFEVMALMMVMMELNTVMDGNSKTMTVFREGIMAMADSLMVAVMLGPEIGPPVALITMLLGGLGIAAKMAADPDIDSLNQELDKIAQKEQVATTLAKIMNWTEAEAAAALKAAGNNQDLADSLDKVAKEREGPSIIDRLAAFYESKDIAALTDDANKFAEAFTNTADKASVSYDELHLKAVQAADAITTSFDKLTSTLSTDAEQTAAGQLSNLAGVGQDVAKQFLSVASTDDDLARSTQDLTTKIITEEAALAALEATGKALPSDVTAMRAAIDGWKNGLDDLIKSQVALAASEADAKRIANEVSSISSQSTTQQSKDAQTLKDSLADIGFQRVQQEENNTQQIFQTNQAMDDAIFKANQELNNALADDAQKLADSEFKSQQTLGDDLNNLAYQHQKQEQDIANQLVTAQVTAANDISKAYRDMLQTLADDDWNTHESLENAKTENEREQILERAAHEKAGVREKFQNTVDDAETRITEEKRVSAIKEQLDDQDYAHSVLVDQNKYNEEIANAQRTYAEEVALAERRDAQAIDDARKKDSEQLASLVVRLTQEEEALNQQEDNARRRAAEQIALSNATTEAQIKDLQTLLDAQTKAYQSALEMQVSLMAFFQGDKNVSVPAFGTWASVTGKAGGGDVMGGQTYLVGENGPELLRMPMGTSGTIIPNSSTTTYGGHTFIINGATDPKAVAEEVRKVLSDAVWQ